MAGYLPTPVAPAAAVTPQTFATGLLKAVGAPTTPQNVSSLVAWEGKEGGNWNNTAKYNPLNTTEPEPGYTKTGTQGNIGSYLNWNQGTQATAKTLENGNYGDVLGALKSGRGLAGTLPGLSKWSGGAYNSISPTAAPVATTASVATTAPASTSQNQTRQQYVQGIAKGLIAKGDISDFSDKLTAALAKNPYSGQIAVGTTQNIPSEHLGTIAQLGDDPHNLALASAMAISHDPRLSQFNQVVTTADQINNAHYNYEWGGGHNSSFAPTTGTGHGSGAGVGYDCSGTLSHVLHMAGLLNQPLVASQFAQLNHYIPQAQPGVGTGPHTITIYANADHTYANIGGTYFGTSTENRGGGAGWIGSTTENNNADYTAWHINF